VSLYVDNILDISWNEEAFERLVLPHDYKRLIQAFVHTQLSAVDNFDDIMSGKGKCQHIIYPANPRMLTMI
jgi:hypothetical protein